MQDRTVVKIGSSSLTAAQGELNGEQIRFYAKEIADLRRDGEQILLVTSGAVAAGFRRVGYRQRPKAVHEKQASAALGQALLMQAYQEAFGRHGLAVAQILLTRADFSERKRIHNAMMTIEELLNHGIVPVINENDTVATDELGMKFGDNDTLSALTANLVKARRLVIVTDMDGLYTDDPRKNPEAVRIDRVGEITEELFRIAGGAGTGVGTGGMRSKLEAARIAMRGGIPVFIGKVEAAGDLLHSVAGRGKGTYFDTDLHSLPMKKQWIGFHSFPQGRIAVDEGAVDALLKGGRSLLPAGVREIQGEFHPGDVVEVTDLQGRVIGRGVVNYASWQLQAAAGMNSAEVLKRFDVARLEVIHRDEWMAHLR